MATNTGTTSGAVAIGASGAVPIVQFVVGSTTPTITDQLNGQIERTNAAGALVVPFGAVTTALLVHLRFFDVSTDLARNCGLSVNFGAGLVVFAATQEFLWSSAVNTSGITAITITPEAGNDTRMEYVIAGV